MPYSTLSDNAESVTSMASACALNVDQLRKGTHSWVWRPHSSLPLCLWLKKRRGTPTAWSLRLWFTMQPHVLGQALPFLPLYFYSAMISIIVKEATSYWALPEGNMLNILHINLFDPDPIPVDRSYYCTRFTDEGSEVQRCLGNLPRPHSQHPRNSQSWLLSVHSGLVLDH